MVVVVKSTLHLFYTTLRARRPLIRTEMSLALRTFARAASRDEDAREAEPQPAHAAVAHLINVLASILAGAAQLKEEHVNIFKYTLLPLHLPASLQSYHPQLRACLGVFVRKLPEAGRLASDWVLRHWPRQSTSKQVLLLDELSEVLLMDRSAPQWLSGSASGAALLAHVAALMGEPHHAVVSAAMDLMEQGHPVAAAMATQPAGVRERLSANLRHTIEHNWNNDVKIKAKEVLAGLPAS